MTAENGSVDQRTTDVVVIQVDYNQVRRRTIHDLNRSKQHKSCSTSSTVLVVKSRNYRADKC